MLFLSTKIEKQVVRTKLQQLVHSITEAISNRELKIGDTLPSVNQMSKQSGFSRDTVFKAYGILKQRNIIESAPMKGYFVSGGSFKVFLLLDDFSAFKEQLYQSFRQNLPDSYSVDLLFHHYNKDVFNQLVESSLGRYSMYIVMNIDEHGMAPVLNKIDPNKLLLLDMGKPTGEKVNYLLQNFDDSLVNCLQKGIDRLKKYDRMILVYDPHSTPHPALVVSAAERFCRKNSMAFKQIETLNSTSVQSGSVYFVIRDSDLVKVVENCKSSGYQLGKEVGVLSYNDTPMKQIAGGGITVISADFEKMGREAAHFVKNKHKTAMVLPTSLILRNSV